MKILVKVALASLACLLLTEVVPVPYCGVASTQAQVVPALAVTEEELVLDREEDRLTLYWSGRVAYVKPSEEPLSVVTSVSLAPSGVWSSAAGRRAHHVASQKRGLNVLSEKTSVATSGAIEKIGSGPWYRQIALLFDKDQVVKLKVALNRTGSMATDAPPLAEMNFRLSPLGYGLLAAARAGDVSAVRELLDKGADADSADLGGWTALMAAASEGRRDVVDLLLDRGAKVNARGKGLPFQLSANGSKEPSGTTALMASTYAGNSEVVRVLLAKNASVNSKREDQWTALMCATYADNANALSSLLGAGAEINATNDAGYSALALAIINGNKAAARLLEARGAILRVPWNTMAE